MMDNDIPMRLWDSSVKKDGTPSLSADGVRAKWPGGSGRIGDCVYVGGSMEFIGSLSIDGTLGSRHAALARSFYETISKSKSTPLIWTISARINKEILESSNLAAMISLSMCQNAVIRCTQMFATTLPLSICEQLIIQAKRIQNASAYVLKTGHTALMNPFKYLLDLPDGICTPQNRFDIISLFETLLNINRTITTFLISEAEPSSYLIVHDGLQPTSSQTKSIRNATTEDEVFKCIKSDLRSCNWCSAPASVYRMQICTGCRKLDYCSKECQKRDWIGFHKSECAELKTRSKMEVGMNISRYFYLRQFGERRATMPIPCPEGVDLFAGDEFHVYLCAADLETGIIGPKTFPFPRGWRAVPRGYPRGNH